MYEEIYNVCYEKKHCWYETMKLNGARMNGELNYFVVRDYLIINDISRKHYCTLTEMEYLLLVVFPQYHMLSKHILHT